MKIRDLIRQLADYPPDALVHVYDRRDGSVEDLEAVDPQPTTGDIDDGMVLLVNAPRTESNAYRRGALEQLFDEVSTGIAPCGSTHEEIREASGDDKWTEQGEKMLLKDKTIEVINTTFDLLLAEAVKYTTTELMDDWPDEDAIRNKVNDIFWARFDDELQWTPANVPDEVRDNADAWDVFVEMVFDRAHKAAKAARGY